MRHQEDRWLGSTRLRSAPMPKPPIVQAITSLAADVRRRSRIDAVRRKLDAMMSQVSAIRARRECTEAELDQAAGAYAKAAIAIATRGQT